MGNVLCHVIVLSWAGEARIDVGLHRFLPGPHYSWLMELLRSQKHSRSAGVGYSFDLLDQFLLQNASLFVLRGGRADELRLKGSRETPTEVMGNDCVGTGVCYVYKYVCMHWGKIFG